ncbi:MAG: hypothetical protein J5835_02100, partial [Bacteroidales bacterium]|nr:hypothetical protein [Bacteroidales bacterium]
VPQSQYLYGTNEFVTIQYDDGSPMFIKDVMDVFKDPKMKAVFEGGGKYDFICARNIVIPENKENCLKYGIVPEKIADEIPDHIMLTMSKDKNYLSKPEIFLLDLLSNYEWDRPLHVLNQGGDLNVGIKEYLMYDGFSAHFTPIKNKIASTDAGKVDALKLYEDMKTKYSWKALRRTDWFVDYQNMYTFLGVLGQRQLYLTVANALIDAHEDEKALEIMDLCQENVPEENFPLETISVGFVGNDYMVAQLIENYYYLGAGDKALDLASRFSSQLLETASFYIKWGSLGMSEFESCARVLLYVSDVCKQYGDKELGEKLEGMLSDMIHAEE